MNLLSETHDYVIVDTPARLTEDTLAILDAATHILIVVTFMTATVANARSAIDTFEALGYKGQKPILLVVNQSDTAGGMSKGGLEHALALPVIAEIPTDWKTVSESLNKQQPFVLANPTSPIAKSLENLATALVSQHRK
jgi:pilus assembly protein CpaE